MWIMWFSFGVLVFVQVSWSQSLGSTKTATGPANCANWNYFSFFVDKYSKRPTWIMYYIRVLSQQKSHQGKCSADLDARCLCRRHRRMRGTPVRSHLANRRRPAATSGDQTANFDPIHSIWQCTEHARTHKNRRKVIQHTEHTSIKTFLFQNLVIWLHLLYCLTITDLLV